MLALLQRLLPTPRAPLPELDWLAGWAALRADELKQVRGQPGFVIRNEFHGRRMRIECGRSQRDYIEGNELRLRYELNVPASMEMLVMNAALAETLEGRTFDKLTAHDQTEVTASLPEEARWLAMFERVDLAGLAPEMGRRFVAVGSQPAVARQWLEGELAARLARATSRWLSADTALVILIMRGRLYVRSHAVHLDQPMLNGLRGLADAAALSAMNLRPRRSSDAPAAEVAATPGAADAELRALDAAILQTGLLDFDAGSPMDAFADLELQAQEAEDQAIEGMSVVICETAALAPLTFPTEADDPDDRGGSLASRASDEAQADLPDPALLRLQH